MAKTILHGTMKGARGEEDRRKKMRRSHQGIDRNRVWRFPEGSGRQGRVERYCCSVICDATTTEMMRDEISLCQFPICRTLGMNGLTRLIEPQL